MAGRRWINAGGLTCECGYCTLFRPLHSQEPSVGIRCARGTTISRAQSNTRVEQNDPSVVYTGNWHSNSSSANSGALAALTNTRGARVSLAFTGSGINWIGTSDRWAGLATVYVDGEMTIVNTYGNDSRAQQVLFERAVAHER